MSKPVHKPPQTKSDAAEKARLQSLVEHVEKRTLLRAGEYLGRGRPLAGLPLVSLRAQWIDASVVFLALRDESRAPELDDLETEFGLRGLEPPDQLIAKDVLSFVERYKKELLKRKPDPAARQRFEQDVEDLSDRLLAQDRATFS